MAISLSASALSGLPKTVAGPAYERSALTAGILHVGVGNFHRAHMAVYLDDLFATGVDMDWALVGAGVRAADTAMREKLAGQDWLSTVVELDPGGLHARIVGSMIDFVAVDPARTVARMSDPEIRIVSMTITEGGYYVNDLTDRVDTEHPDIAHDAAHPDNPRSIFGMILAALRARREAGEPAFTVMSCDNLPENGNVARRTVLALAQLADPGFADWVARCVAFPNSMVDCITPATSERERALVRERFDLVDAAPVVCEPFRQWVLEDRFSHGRPRLERVGVEFVSDVAPFELMKLRVLNGGHAAIAYPSALLGYEFVHDAMADPLIRDWLAAVETREIIPTLPPIPGVDLAAYLGTVTERFSNPAVGDTIPRLCLDGSNRQPKFILPTLRQALSDGGAFEGLALEVAFWCRYCAGKDEAGRDISPNDVRSEDLRTRALQARSEPDAFIGDALIFGDLGQDARFAAAFSRHLMVLWEEGTSAALTRYLGT